MSGLPDEEVRAFLKTLGARIKQIRQQKKLKVLDVMLRGGYYDAQWRKYEAGANLNVPSLMRIARALDVPLIELLDGLGTWPMKTVSEIQAESSLSQREQIPEDSSVTEQSGKRASTRNKRSRL